MRVKQWYDIRLGRQRPGFNSLQDRRICNIDSRPTLDLQQQPRRMRPERTDAAGKPPGYDGQWTFDGQWEESTTPGGVWDASRNRGRRFDHLLRPGDLADFQQRPVNNIGRGVHRQRRRHMDNYHPRPPWGQRHLRSSGIKTLDRRSPAWGQFDEVRTTRTPSRRRCSEWRRRRGLLLAVGHCPVLLITYDPMDTGEQLEPRPQLLTRGLEDPSYGPRKKK